MAARLLLAASYADGRMEQPGGARTGQCELSLGEAACGFRYTSEGELLHEGASLTPPVKVNPQWVPSFSVSISPSRTVAAAIAQDGDGHNRLFVLHLEKGSAQEIGEPGTWVAARRAYWSPSRRYLLAWCAYEGESFLRVDLRTGGWRDLALPPKGDRIWHLQGEAHWMEGKDVLAFAVEEFCNYYDGCLGSFITVPDDLRGKALAMRDVQLDAATLRLTSRPRGRTPPAPRP